MNATPDRLPVLDSAQVREVDRLAEARFGLPVEWLMEAAGWQVARSCEGLTAVVCGPGSNGGDGLAAARHLHRWGRLHSVVALDRTRPRGAAAKEAEALEASGVEIGAEPDLKGAELVLDAIFGSGLDRGPEERAAEWIDAVNGARLRVIAVDIPSGLRSDDGVAYRPAVKADLTVTLGLAKAGLLIGDGPALSGEVWVVDIGIPPEAYAMVGAAMPADLFRTTDRVRLR
jgi:ADP-dependent NAD(P)H-hydrate dehydratase / NAD(P)H-hydrate epimerase